MRSSVSEKSAAGFAKRGSGCPDASVAVELYGFPLISSASTKAMAMTRGTTAANAATARSRSRMTAVSPTTPRAGRRQIRALLPAARRLQ
jgi:hypothetical protein